MGGRGSSLDWYRSLVLAAGGREGEENTGTPSLLHRLEVDLRGCTSFPPPPTPTPPSHWSFGIFQTMSTGSLSDVEDLQEVEMLECDGLKMDTNKEFGASTESNEEGSNGENGSPQKGRGASGKRKKAPPKKSPLNGVSQEGKQVQRNAANARERARMRVLSKAFSRLKTTLPWVPPDTKLSKLDTLRLASSYIAHLRQILANDKYENGYIHPVNLVSFSRGARHLVRDHGERQARSWDGACVGRNLHCASHRKSGASGGGKGYCVRGQAPRCSSALCSKS